MKRFNGKQVSQFINDEWALVEVTDSKGFAIAVKDEKGKMKAEGRKLDRMRPLTWCVCEKTCP